MGVQCLLVLLCARYTILTLCTNSQVGGLMTMDVQRYSVLLCATRYTTLIVTLCELPKAGGAKTMAGQRLRRPCGPAGGAEDILRPAHPAAYHRRQAIVQV